MFKKLLLIASSMLISTGLAFAQSNLFIPTRRKGFMVYHFCLG